MTLLWQLNGCQEGNDEVCVVPCGFSLGNFLCRALAWLQEVGIEWISATCLNRSFCVSHGLGRYNCFSLSFWRQCLLLQTILNRLYPRSLKKRQRVGDEDMYLFKERNLVSDAHSPTLACRKNLVLEKLTNDISDHCVGLEKYK